MGKKPGAKVYAIITAGGTGSRFGKNSKLQKQRLQKPKQFMKLLGKPVILYSMTVFQKCKGIDEIIISADKKYFDYLHRLALKHNIKKLTRLVEGGKTRFESVKNAFRSIENQHNNDLILIHDAARPNISAFMVQDMLNHSCEIITGCRISETIKRDKNSYVAETIPRENLWNIQTPQVFRYGILKASYKKCARKNDFTDEASMAERA